VLRLTMFRATETHPQFRRSIYNEICPHHCYWSLFRLPNTLLLTLCKECCVTDTTGSTAGSENFESHVRLPAFLPNFRDMLDVMAQ
jgi:hypothetical protein